MFHTPAHKHIGPPAGQIRNPATQGGTISTEIVQRIQAVEAALDKADPLRQAARTMAESSDLFLRSIGRALEYATPHNRNRLYAAFPEVIGQFMPTLELQA